MLSEILEEELPFIHNPHLNFILPMHYRTLSFPLINVTEIQIEKIDGSNHLYSERTQNNFKASPVKK
jgi:hypothetical protein